MAFVIIFHTFIFSFLGSFLLLFLGSFLLSSLCVSVSSSVCVDFVSLLVPGARLVAPAVGDAYLLKWSNIALQALQMGVNR